MLDANFRFAQIDLSYQIKYYQENQGISVAIGFARLEYVKRSSKKNSCAKSAYNSRGKIVFEGTEYTSGRLYDWTYKEKPSYHDVLLPDQVDSKFKDPSLLWNIIEKLEKRVDSQLAMELVLALPDDEIISLDDKANLAISFAKANFVQHGFAAQIDIHPPEQQERILEETGEKEENSHNWHVHLLIPTRRFNERGDDLETKKPRDIGAVVRKGYAISGTNWGKLWTQHQNEYFESKGLDLRVDPTGVVAQLHLGPRRMMGKNSSLLLDSNDHLSEENRRALSNPSTFIKKLTESKSIFTQEDLEKHLQQLSDPNEMAKLREQVWKHKGLVQLMDRQDQAPLQFFSSVEVVEEEKKILRLAEKMSARTSFLIDSTKINEHNETLNEEQKKAFLGIVQGSSLSCIEGHAGTGKSVLLAALKDVYQANGYKVRAFGPDNASAIVLEEKGLTNATNIHRFLFKKYHATQEISTGKEVWIVDEAGKISNGPLLEFLKVAEKSKAQVIFAGNSAQLPPVERGGMFQDFCNRFGCQFLENIQRQSKEEQRDIAKKLAKGEIASAINMIASTGGFKWSPHKDGAMMDAFAQWVKDRSHFPYSSHLLIAHSNREVMQFNELVHYYRKSLGELGDKEFECDGPFGRFLVSTGDIIEFRKNASLGVSNGLKGTLLSAKENRFEVVVKQRGRERKVVFDPREYSSFHLGYASTYYRSQGQTVDRAYVMYSSQMSREMFYVGLTRHVKQATCFISMEDASCLARVKMQVMRSSAKKTTLNYTTQTEIDHENLTISEKQKVRQLLESESTLDRLKGGGLQSWTYVKGKLSNLIETVKDRVPDRDFYNPDLPFKVEGKGRVKEVEPTTLIEEGARLVDTILDVEAKQDGLVKNPTSTKAKTQPNLGEGDKNLIRRYFDKVEESNALHLVVQSESISRGCDESLVPSFEDWQKSCGYRNQAASELYSGLSPKVLKSVMTKGALERIKEQSERVRQPENKEALEVKLKGKLEPLLQQLFPEGPTRKDTKGFRFGSKGSFSVVCHGEKLGSFYDFAAGEGGNLLKLIQKKTGLGVEESKEWARNFLEEPSRPVTSQFTLKPFKETLKNDWKSLKPPKGSLVPELKVLSKYLDERYHVSMKHPYHDEKGDVIFYTLRLQDKTDAKSKIVVPLSYGYSSSNPDRQIWSLKRPILDDGSISIYNCHLLNKSPRKPVLIVEGEKTADAGQKIFGKDFVVVSWLGGTGSATKANWSKLAGRDVVIWPDNDQPGYKAADEISDEMKRIGVRTLRVVDKGVLSAGFPTKWDIADALPEGKTEQSLVDLISRADQKAVPSDRLLSLLESHGLNDDSFFNQQRINEILWRADQRMRPHLEKEFGSKTWEIESSIIAEVSSILQHRSGLKENDVGKQKSEEQIFSDMLLKAKTGKWPNIRSEGTTDLVIPQQQSLDKPEQSNERTHDLSREQAFTRDL